MSDKDNNHEAARQDAAAALDGLAAVLRGRGAMADDYADQLERTAAHLLPEDERSEWHRTSAREHSVEIQTRLRD